MMVVLGGEVGGGGGGWRGGEDGVFCNLLSSLFRSEVPVSVGCLLLCRSRKMSLMMSCSC